MRASSLSRSIMLGGATGIHVMSGLASVSCSAMVGELDLDDTPFAVLGQPDATVLLLASAATEIVVDKFPVLPARTSTYPLTGRIAVAGVLGAATAVAAKESIALGSAVAICAAIGTAFAGTAWRRYAVHHGIPDFPAGVADSTVAVTLARRAMS